MGTGTCHIVEQKWVDYLAKASLSSVFRCFASLKLLLCSINVTALTVNFTLAGLLGFRIAGVTCRQFIVCDCIEFLRNCHCPCMGMDHKDVYPTLGMSEQLFF